MDPYKYFPNRRPDEKIELLLRRHWHAFLRHFLLFIVEFFLPLIILFIIFQFTTYTFEKDNVLSIVIVLAASAYYLYIWLFFFNHWIDYYLDVWVVTNQRILNIEQKGLFFRTIAELNIEKVQDVTSEVKGKLATILNFGDVHIQTAAEQKRFIFEEIPKPREVAARIIELHQEAEEKAMAEHRTSTLTDSSKKEENFSLQNKDEARPF